MRIAREGGAKYGVRCVALWGLPVCVKTRGLGRVLPQRLLVEGVCKGFSCLIFKSESLSFMDLAISLILSSRKFHYILGSRTAMRMILPTIKM